MNTIKDIVKKGIDNALNRLNRISFGKWEFGGIEIDYLKPSDDEVICVYLPLREKHLFSSLLTVDKRFTREFFKEVKGNQLLQVHLSETVYEFLICEIGNIILNSIISEFANVKKTKIIPDYPKTINGIESFIVENIFSFLCDYHKEGLIMSKVILKTPSCEIPLKIYLFVSNDFLKGIF